MQSLDANAAVRTYLAPFASSPWRWDKEAEVIEWTDSSTIVFRAELASILARLAPHGLPPLSAVVLLLAACRDGWPGESHRLGTIAGSLATLGRGEFPDWLGKLFQQLDAVRALPDELRTTSSAKADLAEMVFEECRIRTSIEDAEAIRWALSSYLSPETLTPQSDSLQGLEGILRDLRCLFDGMKKFDAEKLKLRKRTGLDQLVRPADFELPPAEMARRLITRLHDDQELGGMARIARQLLAAMHLPHALSDHEDLPVGGVSDITNRGSLDRLLLSELAYDDLTLAVRIALREALYLRRETPPKNPPKHRAVLIDAGIRLWGIPRVFATAVALTLAATSDRNIRIDAYRACGRKVEQVSLTQREGLIAHLEALEPEVHPGDAIEAFLAAVSKQGDLVDAVVVTSEDVVEDLHFQQAIDSRELPSLLLATVSREGRFRLISWSSRRRKMLREARLDLEKLLSPPSWPVAPLVESALLTMPAILRQKPFPLLLSHPMTFKQAWATSDGSVLSLGLNRCLLHWNRPDRGGHLLDDSAPAGQVHWTSNIGNSVSLAVVGQLQCGRLWLLRVDLLTGSTESMPLELNGTNPRGVCEHGGKVIVIYSDSADVFETISGRHLERLKLPHGARWQSGRFLRRWQEWFVIAHNGVSATVEPLVTASKQRTIPNLLALIDNPECEGPIGLTKEGHLYDFTRERLLQVYHGLLGIPCIMAIARSGKRVVIAQKDILPTKLAVIDIPSGAARRVSGNSMAFAEPEIYKADGARRNVSHRFRAVCVRESHFLTLIRPKGNGACIQPYRHHHEITLQPQVISKDQQQCFVEFQEILSPSRTGYTLHTATWNDGSRAMLDSRGMLHLKSSDLTIPELTLVLCDGALAGWCADGRWFGPAYFIGDHTPTNGAVIYDEVLKPFVARLR